MFIDAIEVTVMIERYYTREQRDQLRRRERELGSDAVQQTQGEWSDVIDALRSEHARGADPESPRVRELARRWQELVRRFTGGDEGLHASLRQMYEQEGAEKASRGAFDEDLMQYIGRATSALPDK